MMKTRIAYCIERLDNPRGTERVLSTIVNSLADIYEITIITSSQKDRPDFFPLHPDIKRVDIAINTGLKHNTVFHNRILNDYKRKLSSFLQKEKFDVVIALSGLQFYFLHSIQDGSFKIAWFHFSFDISNHLIGNRYHGYLKRLLVYLHTQRRIWHARKYARLVVVSRSDANIWRLHCDNVVYIYNPITIETREHAKLLNKSCIAVGSLTVEKGFDMLIDSWILVNKMHPEWNLNIFGDGCLRDRLQQQINKNNLQNVVQLRGVSQHLEREYLQHSICIMSSRTEAFSLVLVEATCCGLPAVAYKCKDVISEIITDGENGVLAEPVGDCQILADKICYLIENENIRKRMGKIAVSKAKVFSIDKVRKEWVSLIDELLL